MLVLPPDGCPTPVFRGRWLATEKFLVTAAMPG